MGRLGIGICLFLALVCADLQAAPQKQKMTRVTGKLERVVGIGGETTGWAIQLESPLRIEGKPVKSVEISGLTELMGKLENKRVEASGKLSYRSGVERGRWPVLEVSTIQEAKSK